MSTPGHLVVPDKTTLQAIPTGDVPVPIRVVDPTQGIDTDRFNVEQGPTTFHLQVQARFHNTVAQRPNRVIVELMRYLPGGALDSTGKSLRAISQPGTTTWVDTFSVDEDVNPGEVIGWCIRHNGAAPITVTVRVVKTLNPLAMLVHRMGGFTPLAVPA